MSLVSPCPKRAKNPATPSGRREAANRAGILALRISGAGELPVEPESLRHERLRSEQPVVDLALTRQGWKLLEFNCINTAGLYAVDARLIVAAFHGRSLSGNSGPRPAIGNA
jgi:hypothetical protein